MTNILPTQFTQPQSYIMVGQVENESLRRRHIALILQIQVSSEPSCVLPELSRQKCNITRAVAAMNNFI